MSMNNINSLDLVLDVCCVSCQVQLNWKYFGPHASKC
jgi:hypothetical protein